VNLTSGEPVLLKEGQQVTFTFAVNWLPTATPFGQRFERYLDYNFFEHKVGAADGVA
jgi:transmembrane 9 superfamily protein 3